MSQNNFWKNLKKPFFVLAPMADVTDASFRRVIAKYGKPDVTWTEFVSADGLVRASEEGKKKLMKDLLFSEAERPIVAQLFSGRPEYMEEAAKLVESLGFDGIDINMGCPDKTIEKQKSGASLIKNPELAKELIRAAKRGAPTLPISVKTRVGYNKIEIEDWIPALLEEDIVVLTIHARTRKEMSKVPANWDLVKKVVAIRDSLKKETLIIGNGDVKTIAEGEARVKETGCDGVMIGRGIFGNPWAFRKDGYTPTLPEKVKALIEHISFFDELLGDTKHFALMKKHFKSYLHGFEGAHSLRENLMNAEGAKEAQKILTDFLSHS
ncbi:MAG: hypothetical protein QG585_455 [Patescibacteria group bacterium]|nr:hypothetical protein [Patescibacteria group bacterium]